MAGRRLFGLLTGLIALAGIIGSLRPELAPPGQYSFDKILHLLGYGGLAFCLTHALGRPYALLAAGLAAGLGGGLEIVQSWIPDRQGSWDDALSNAVGAGLGTMLAVMSSRLYPMTEKHLMHIFHPTLLREYDVRGIIGQTLGADDAYALGRRFGHLVRQRTGGGVVCVGRDGRISSPMLEQALVKGLLSVGCQVRRIGLVPTPTLYFAQLHLAAQGAIQVTGSHNPPDHNGFKLMLGGKPFFAADLAGLGQMADPPSQPGGHCQDVDLTTEYLHTILDRGWQNDGRPLTVVWDPGNGAAGRMVTDLVQHLPGRHVVINGAIDGTFPNHHPDPTDPDTLHQLRQAIADQRADLGVAFDGDGDRLGVMDGRGRIIWADQYLMLLADQVLSTHPGAPIVADVKASDLLFQHIRHLGGQAVMGRTGHSLMKAQMADLKSPLGGEMSGHVFFADRYFGFDDALYAALRLLSLVANLPAGGLADWFDGIPRRISTPEIRFDCPDQQKAQVVHQVRDHLLADGADLSQVDGVRVSRPDGWWLLRASNTQAVLVARAEAADAAGLSRLLADLTHYLGRAGLLVDTACWTKGI